MVEYREGNLLDSDCNVICHQVNCQGKMGAGIAFQIRKKWPKVYFWFNYVHTSGKAHLGKIDVIDVAEKKWVVNMYSQENYGRQPICYTDYDAFEDCLIAIKERFKNIPNLVIGFPNHIGCGLAGGDWDIIKGLIEKHFNSDEWKVIIFRLEEK